MILAFNNIIPPTYWFHDRDIGNRYGKNVNYYLIHNMLPVPTYYSRKDL